MLCLQLCKGLYLSKVQPYFGEGLSPVLSGLTLGLLWLCRGLGLEYHAHVPPVNTGYVYRHPLARAGEVPLCILL